MIILKKSNIIFIFYFFNYIASKLLFYKSNKMEEYTKYKLKKIWENILRIIFIFILQFLLLYFSMLFANNMMYLFFLWSLFIWGIYFFFMSLVMLWWGVWDKREAFFSFVIWTSCIIWATYFPKIISNIIS